MKSGGDLNYEELVLACKNVGVDLTCGACAGIFYTGISTEKHTCAPLACHGCLGTGDACYLRHRRDKEVTVDHRRTCHLCGGTGKLTRLDPILRVEDD